MRRVGRLLPAPRVVSALAALALHPYASRARLEAFRAQRLRRLVAHAAARVPFYRRLFAEAGIDAQQIRQPEDLRQLPITSRAQLQEASLFERLCEGARAESLVKRRTSGSSGQPLDIWRTQAEERLLQAFRWRARLQAGRRLSDRFSTLAHPGTTDAARFPWLLRAARSLGLQREHLISCFDAPEQQARLLEAQRPQVINGLAGSIWRLSQYLAQRPHRLRPRCLHVGGEVLNPAMRSTIERAFAAPVFDFYGSHECNLLAWQCPEGFGYHVCDDSLVLEVLRDGQPVAEGELGAVVVTLLHSYTMPFLR